MENENMAREWQTTDNIQNYYSVFIETSFVFQEE